MHIKPSFARTPVAAAIAVALAGSGAAAAATNPGDAGTGDIAVNTYTTDSQQYPLIAGNAVGAFVVAWQGLNQDADTSVYVRAFAADGRPHTAALLANVPSSRTVYPTQVGMAADGGFVVVWYDGWDAWVRPFAADGTPLAPPIQVTGAPVNDERIPLHLTVRPGGEFTVHYTSAEGWHFRSFFRDGTQRSADRREGGVLASQAQLAVGGDGTFVLGFTSQSQVDVYARRFGEDGTALTPRLLVWSPEYGQANMGKVAMDDDGDFVIGWRSRYDDDYYYADEDKFWGAHVRAYSADGVPRADTYDLQRADNHIASPTELVMDGDGDFAVLWRATPSTRRIDTFDSSGAHVGTFPMEGGAVRAAVLGPDRFVLVYADSSVRARIHHIDGTPLTGLIPIREGLGGAGTPDVRVDAAGNFMVLWSGSDSQGRLLEARPIRADGWPAAPAFAINELPAAHQGDGRTLTHTRAASGATLDADGDLAVAWFASRGNASGLDVWARRFAGFSDVDLAVSQSDSADPVEPGQTFDYVLRVDNAHPGAPDPAVGLADGITLVDTLPAGVTLAGWSGAGWTCDASGGPVRCDLDHALAPGTHSSVTLGVVAPPAMTQLSNSVHVRGAQVDAFLDNDQSAEATGMADLTPDAFTFRNRNNVEPGTVVRSGPVTIAGLGVPVPVALAGDASARWSRNGSAFDTAPGTIANGDVLELQLVAGPLAHARNARRMTVTVGSYQAAFAVRTIEDSEPDPLDFPDRGTRSPAAWTTSAALVAGGFTVRLRANVGGDPSCRLRVDGGDWSRRARIEPGQSLQLRLRSAAEPGASRSCSVSVGDAFDGWTVTTVRP